MSETIRERYNPKVVGANSTVTLTSISLGGFLCLTSGTITVVDGNGTTIVNALPVSAGFYTPMPFYLSKAGATVTTAGGASGTLAV